MQVTLENFRSFRGAARVELQENTTTVVFGPNGSGKTNFAQAIIWALFGNAFSGQKKILTGNLITDGETHCRVRLDFNDFYVSRARLDGSPVIETNLTHLPENQEKERRILERLGIRDANGLSDLILRSIYINPWSQTFLSMTPQQRATYFLSLFGCSILEEMRRHFSWEHRRMSSRLSAIIDLNIPEIHFRSTSEIEDKIRALEASLQGIPHPMSRSVIEEHLTNARRESDKNAGRIDEILSCLSGIGEIDQNRLHELDKLVEGRRPGDLDRMENTRKSLAERLARTRTELDGILFDYQKQVFLLRDEQEALRLALSECGNPSRESVRTHIEQLGVALLALRGNKASQKVHLDGISRQIEKSLECPECNAALMLGDGVLEKLDIDTLRERRSELERVIAGLDQRIASTSVDLEKWNSIRDMIEKEDALQIRREALERSHLVGVSEKEAKISELSVALAEVTADIEEQTRLRPLVNELEELKKREAQRRSLQEEYDRLLSANQRLSEEIAGYEQKLELIDRHSDDFKSLEVLRGELASRLEQNELFDKFRAISEERGVLEKDLPVVGWIVKQGIPNLVSTVIIQRVFGLMDETNRILDTLETPYKLRFEPQLDGDGMLSGVKILCYTNLRWSPYEDIGSLAQMNLFRLAAVAAEKNLYGCNLKGIGGLTIFDDPFFATYGDMARAVGNAIGRLSNGTTIVLTGYEHMSDVLTYGRCIKTAIKDGKTVISED